LEDDNCVAGCYCPDEGEGRLSTCQTRVEERWKRVGRGEWEVIRVAIEKVATEARDHEKDKSPCYEDKGDITSVESAIREVRIEALQ
jgi:hypothetical protein